MKKFLKIIYHSVLALLALFLLAFVATFLPIPGNYKIYTVQSGSMEPAIKTGSLVFVRPAGTYSVGDIITSKIGKNNYVTHRIVEKSVDSFQTKGDANKDADSSVISESQIVGKVFFALPYAGYPIGYAKTRLGFIFMIIVPATIIVYEEIKKIKKETASGFKKWREKKAVSKVVNVHYREPGFSAQEKMYSEPPKKKRKII